MLGVHFAIYHFFKYKYTLTHFQLDKLFPNEHSIYFST